VSIARRLSTLALLLTGCTGALTVSGEIVQPARMPVRAFPRVLVTSSLDAESREVADAIAGHLSGGSAQVDRAPPEAIDILRTEEGMRRGTIVVDVRVRVRELDDAAWGARDDLECGPSGCFRARRLAFQDESLVAGELAVTVNDGPSARELQRIQLLEQERGADVIAMRLRVLERLANGALALLDQRTERVPVHLYPIDRPEVVRALDSVYAGSWAEGRRMLERFVHTERFGQLSDEQRALVLYDLAQALRFDTTLEPDVRFEGAHRALSMAVRLAPQPRYARAIHELDEHRRCRALVRRQHEAAAHNYALYARAREDERLR
jgi:hypothetical protein